MASGQVRSVGGVAVLFLSLGAAIYMVSIYAYPVPWIYVPSWLLLGAVFFVAAFRRGHMMALTPLLLIAASTLVLFTPIVGMVSLGHAAAWGGVYAVILFAGGSSIRLIGDAY